jgi:hypothetical protein
MNSQMKLKFRLFGVIYLMVVFVSLLFFIDYISHGGEITYIISIGAVLLLFVIGIFSLINLVKK